jgi:DNA-binding response OmpR family regulator
MRLLSLNISEKLIDDLRSDELYICDVAEDLNDAQYHLYVRFYNMIVFKENALKKVKELLKSVNQSKCAVVLVTENIDKDFEIQALRSGATTVIQEPASDELIKARLQAIHRENFASKLSYNTFTLDKKKGAVLDQEDRDLKLGKKSFKVLSYLLQNRDNPPISKDEIVNVVWEEPEYVSDNVVEVNINQLRKVFRQRFNTSLISTVRHRGYQLKSKSINQLAAQ